jgi:hypothetical protein
MSGLVDIRRGDLPRYPDGRLASICRSCRRLSTRARVRPCEACGGEMKPTVIWNVPPSAPVRGEFSVSTEVS